MSDSLDTRDSTPTIDFTAEDNAFFEEGEKLADESYDSFADLDEDYRRPSFWRRLVNRRR